jgi:hypothetical protein
MRVAAFLNSLNSDAVNSLNVPANDIFQPTNNCLTGIETAHIECDATAERDLDEPFSAHILLLRRGKRLRCNGAELSTRRIP